MSPAAKALDCIKFRALEPKVVTADDRLHNIMVRHTCYDASRHSQTWREENHVIGVW